MLLILYANSVTHNKARSVDYATHCYIMNILLFICMNVIASAHQDASRFLTGLDTHWFGGFFARLFSPSHAHRLYHISALC